MVDTGSACQRLHTVKLTYNDKYKDCIYYFKITEAKPVTTFNVANTNNPLEVMVSWIAVEITGPTVYTICISEKENLDDCYFNKSVASKSSFTLH